MLTQIEKLICSLQTDSHWLISHYLGPWQHTLSDKRNSSLQPRRWGSSELLGSSCREAGLYLVLSLAVPGHILSMFYHWMGASYRVRYIIRIFINCWLKCDVCQCASVRGSARPDLADRQLYHCYNWRKYRDINYNGNGQSCCSENKYIYMSTNLYKKMMISLV